MVWVVRVVCCRCGKEWKYSVRYKQNKCSSQNKQWRGRRQNKLFCLTTFSKTISINRDSTDVTVPVRWMVSTDDVSSIGNQESMTISDVAALLRLVAARSECSSSVFGLYVCWFAGFRVERYLRALCVVELFDSSYLVRFLRTSATGRAWCGRKQNQKERRLKIYGWVTSVRLNRLQTDQVNGEKDRRFIVHICCLWLLTSSGKSVVVGCWLVDHDALICCGEYSTGTCKAAIVNSQYQSITLYDLGRHDYAKKCLSASLDP